MKKKVLLIAAAALALTACSSKKTSTSTESAKKAASSISSSNVVKQTSNKINLENYRKIKVVEKTGATPSEVTALLGRSADAKSKAKTTGLNATIYTWEGVQNGSAGSNLTVEFANGVAIAKQISGLEVSRSKKITVKDYKSLKKGMTQDEVEEIIGKPNGYSESDYSSAETVLWLYTSGLKSDSSASFYVTFQNNKLIDKSAQNFS
ncbi:hypothetical protein lacNasYZ03_00040 [Lactobacillus nasalidis]|uniref:DUF3862 domain-containing protein n=1 Tax=Lactobacillus nasalidis TaxID=2797258 RepID=A0ABQ3W5Z5_9LACO|nr:DUF3862 domain-containing protein [Lactobacillus nasalidis]GHV98568.1 hypothetical protein lacNasYZ01_17500 [Lactobacillus nasalidis]GHV98621.1 hypothetical protein lacNasYZ02_00510 [Lactobacillus nasalidis]GHW00317.1 hypothetical protein lacNasYZ03_00040 [Lactobacillus nasalidis]